MIPNGAREGDSPILLRRLRKIGTVPGRFRIVPQYADYTLSNPGALVRSAVQPEQKFGPSFKFIGPTCVGPTALPDTSVAFRTSRSVANRGPEWRVKSGTARRDIRFVPF